MLRSKNCLQAFQKENITVYESGKGLKEVWKKHKTANQPFRKYSEGGGHLKPPPTCQVPAVQVNLPWKKAARW